MKKFLLSVLCLTASAAMAYADEAVVTFAGFVYTGDITNQVAFPDGNTETDIDGVVFKVPEVGSFVIKKDVETAKMCYINPEGQNPHMNWEKDNTMTFTLDEGVTVTEMRFYCTTKTYTEPLKPSTGEFTADKNALMGAWKGSATSTLSFTTNTKKVRVKYIEIVYTTGSSSGIAGISVDNTAEVEYYNLQGIRVANPENGVYIRREGTRAKKVYVK